MAKKSTTRIPLGPVSAKWSWDQVQAAQQKFKPSGDYDPASPLNQYYILTGPLPALEIEYTSGNRLALPKAIYFCAIYKLPLPGWVSAEFKDAFRAIEAFEAKSWDEFFGSSLPAGKRIKRQYKVRNFAFEAWVRVCHKSQDGHPISTNTFDLVAEEINAAYGTHRVNSKDVSDFYGLLKKQRSKPGGLFMAKVGPSGLRWDRISSSLTPEFDTYLQERLAKEIEKQRNSEKI